MSTLYMVATPIGNLEDITLRALRILKECDVLLCEDTRSTKRLTAKYAIGTRLMSYHAHSDDSRMNEIAELLIQGKNIAVVTDAGTPGISDPGNELVHFLHERLAEELANGEVKIASVPGPSSLTAAISISGARANEFTFLGFLPHKKGRETLFKEIAVNERTSVFFESTHRILKTLASLKEHCPTKKVTVCRELSKIYEEVVFGTPEVVEKKFLDKPEKTKGEFVVIVSL